MNSRKSAKANQAKLPAKPSVDDFQNWRKSSVQVAPPALSQTAKKHTKHQSVSALYDVRSGLQGKERAAAKHESNQNQDIKNTLSRAEEEPEGGSVAERKNSSTVMASGQSTTRMY